MGAILGGRGLVVALLGAVLVLGAFGCGDEGLPGQEEVPEVSALNLLTGEVKRFVSEGEVPVGWAICGDEFCLVFPADFPCQILGPPTCLLNSACRLKLRCEFDLSSYGWTTARGASDLAEATDVCIGLDPDAEPTDATARCLGSDDSPTPDPSSVADLAPAGCEFVCTAGEQPPSCSELGDPTSCQARSDCQWEQSTIDPAPEPTGSSDPSDGGSSGMPCPPEICTDLALLGYCRDKVASTCQSLDQPSCERRADCEWELAACPLSCAEEGCEIACAPFCQPKTTNPGCPAVEPLPCEEGFLSSPELDDKGCVTGYTCTPVCPDLYVARPECPGGTVQPVVDTRGCILNYVCVQTCPVLIPPKPPCDGTLVPQRDLNGCVVGWRCEPNTEQSCDALQTRYQDVLAQGKRCSTLSSSITDPLGFAPPRPLVQCSLTLPNSLGCPSCPTYVNPANADAVGELRLLQDKWATQGCDKNRICPAIACLEPSGASCEGSSDASKTGEGSCVDGRPTF